MRVRFHEKFEEDLKTACDWYQAQDPRAALRFRRAVYKVVELIGRSPALFSVVGSYHRALIKKFPYNVFFKVENDVIVIKGLLHTARDRDAFDR